MASSSSSEQGNPYRIHTHYDFLPILCGSNRRRKLLYLVAVAFTLSLFFFVQEVHMSEEPLTQPLSSPYIPTTHIDAPSPPVTFIEPVVFTFIMWSESAAAEGALLIKSILLYNSQPSDIHIICDEKAEELLRTRFSLVEHPPHHVRVWFYRPSWQSMLDRVKREGSINTDHSAGLPGLMKLFIHEIIPPTVKKSIYIDTDALFISDPTLLWNVFATLNTSTAIVMASHPEQDAPEWHHASKICSCVMLLDLEKLRDQRLMDSSIYRDLGDFPALSPEAFRFKYGLPGGDGKGRYDNVRLGDQGYWWAIVDYRPDIFEPLSFDFEVTSCLLDTYLTGLGNELISPEQELSYQIHTKDTPQEGRVVLPKLLHFNCLHGTDVYMDWSGWLDPSNPLNIRWGPAVSYHAGFKWIWLNTGQTSNIAQTLEVVTVSDIIFADEMAAKRHL
ncbi:hypothetical protein GALMADRAFT_239225 [Galerina marginata CBS 339.88]|uniref:Glycosyltransferase family 8 protein n=1 Tax=Galerina marginata (strain CBS 339.88) TaxID=685588 RepID=A0A067TDY7_GALM3|nr:hypothetical protein GALMADRAFT_239225 [Galerina marginata CBS 339.88]